MSVAVMRGLIFGWHFQCPECGMGDEELGQLAHADEVYCEICFAEAELHIRLHRWPADHERSRGGGEANAALARAASPAP
jgi:hypothetical protein